MKNSIYISLLLLTAAACQQAPETPPEHVTITGIDSTKNPGDDFFAYVNGIWYDSAQIPPGQSGVGSYMFLNFPQRLRLQKILDSLAAGDYPAGSLEQQVGDFYAAGMDTLAINNRGANPVKPILASIDAVTDIPSLLTLVAEEIKSGNHTFLRFYIGPDFKQSTVNILQCYQTGIGLPERDYYFQSDSITRHIQEAYQQYLATLFTLTGSTESEAKQQASTVYDIEAQLAAAHKTNIELRDVKGNYNKQAIADLTHKQPNLHWPTLLKELGVTADSINMGQPAYYDKLNAMLAAVPLPDWKVYVKGHTLSAYAEYLSKPFTDAEFAYVQALTGRTAQKKRGEEMTSAVDQSLGHALAQLYVKQYFPEEAKTRMMALIENLETAFETRIEKLDWMSDSTKAKAKEKLYAFSEKIGYPDKWRDYSQVTVKPDTYFENCLSANRNDYRYLLDKLGKPVDRSEWHTTPPTVTAYNNPPLNEIVFPAGILQSPYFDLYADDALNYGGIGMVIGHEITHSFDDQGAQFDKEGNVKNWWTADDYEKFKAKTQLVIDQYNTFTVLDSVHLKGPLTVGENTADIAGVAIAYDAFKLTLQGQDTTKIDGYTPDQRFFISVAKIWRVKTTDAFLRMYVKTNNHSPARWRVNGPLMNFTPFYEAFDVQPGDKMYKPEEERITVW